MSNHVNEGFVRLIFCGLNVHVVNGVEIPFVQDGIGVNCLKIAFGVQLCS